MGCLNMTSAVMGININVKMKIFIKFTEKLQNTKPTLGKNDNVFEQKKCPYSNNRTTEFTTEIIRVTEKLVISIY